MKKYQVFTKEGHDYGTPYGTYSVRARADEVAEWLAGLGNVVIIKEIEEKSHEDMGTFFQHMNEMIDAEGEIFDMMKINRVQ